MTGKDQMFSYKGYLIPESLMILTGAGSASWEIIGREHMKQYERYAPIGPDAAVLEVGCGVGRDAMQLEDRLSEKGSYVGIDIIRPSTEWCQANIAARHPSFSFLYLDINSQMYNSGGSLQVQRVTLPVKSRSIDRIILQSVFTHMFFDDIVHYLREFRRILRPEGKVVTSYFIMDDGARQRIDAGDGSPAFDLTFKHPFGDGCWVNDRDYPEGAVAYSVDALDRMLHLSGMLLDQPVHRGYWSGLNDMPDGQDMAILNADPNNRDEASQPTARRTPWSLPRFLTRLRH